MAEDKTAPEPSTAANSSQPRGKSGRKRTIILIILAIGVVLGVIFGWPYYRYAMSHASTDDAFIDGNIVPVSPRVAGHVKKIYVHDNEQVHRGELLVQLDRAPFQAKLRAAQAALAVAKARQRSSHIDTELTRQTSDADLQYAKASLSQAKSALATAKAQVHASNSGLAQAKAQVAAARADANRDQLDLKRYKRLHASGVVSPQTYDHAVASAKASAAQVDEAKAAEAAAEDQQQVAKSRMAEAQAHFNEAQAKLAKAESAPKQVALSASQQPVRQDEVNQAKANMQQAELNLKYTRIYAATSGRVTKKSVQLGEYVSPGQILMSVVPLHVWVTANYKETDLAPIHPGEPVTVSVDAYPDTTFKAHVNSIMEGTGSRFSLLPPENATGNYVKVVQRVPVKIVFDHQPNPAKYHLAPGMSVVPEIDIAVHPDRGHELQTASAATEPSAPTP